MCNLYQIPASKIPIYNCIRSSFRHHLHPSHNSHSHPHTPPSVVVFSLCSGEPKPRERLHFQFYVNRIQNSIPIDLLIRIPNHRRIWIHRIWIVHFPVSPFTPFFFIILHPDFQFTRTISAISVFIFSFSSPIPHFISWNYAICAYMSDLHLPTINAIFVVWILNEGPQLDRCSNLENCVRHLCFCKDKYIKAPIFMVYPYLWSRNHRICHLNLTLSTAMLLPWDQEFVS